MKKSSNPFKKRVGVVSSLAFLLYTREQEFIDATTVALARFVKPEFYK